MVRHPEGQLRLPGRQDPFRDTPQEQIPDGVSFCEPDTPPEIGWLLDLRFIFASDAKLPFTAKGAV